jgi:predicted permease
MRHISTYLWFTVRLLRKNPSFALTAILTLALGVGATTAIFSLVNAVLLRPLPFPYPDQLVWITQEDHSTNAVLPESLSYPDYFDWRAQNRTLQGLASYAGTTLTLTGMGPAEQLNGQTVSSNFFQVLGVAPVLGRDFRLEDEQPGNRTAMLSYPFWQTRFGSDPQVAGRTITLNRQTYTIAGVMPKGFQFPLDEGAPGVWISIATDAEGSAPPTKSRGSDALRIIGRMKAGVTIEQVHADLNVIARNVAAQYPDTNKWYTTSAVTPELKHMVGETRTALGLLLTAVSLLLLIACVNVAGLLLARGAKRSGEIALRGALGATRGEILRQLLVESLVLSLLGGAAGVGLAKVILTTIVNFVPKAVPRLNEVTLDARVLGFAIAVSVVTGLLFGVLPALRMSQLKPALALKEGARASLGGRAQHGLHSWLVVGETALSLVLLIAAGLLLRSFAKLIQTTPGFDPHNVLSARISMPESGYNREQKIQFIEQLLPRLATLPGVISASAGWPMPMSGSSATISFTVEGHPVAKSDHPSEAIGIMLPGYFSTLRIRFIAGRDFTAQDDAKSEQVAIINQEFAKKYFPEIDPIGKHIQVDASDGLVPSGVPRRIVGIVGDTRQEGLAVEAAPQYFVPWKQSVITNPYLCLRTAGNAASFENTLRTTIASMDANMPAYKIHTLDDYVSQSAAEPRFQAVLLGGFAIVAVLLAAVGLYGVLSYIVQQRALELALRLAVGARPADLMRLIVQRGMLLAIAGEALGLIIAASTTRLISTQLYGVKPSDLTTFASVSLLLLFVAFAASTAPAYRAARTDPMTTLRSE